MEIHPWILISLVYACIALSISFLIILALYTWLARQVERGTNEKMEMKSDLVKARKSNQILVKTVADLERKDRDSKLLIENSVAAIRVLLEGNHSFGIKE